MSQENVDRLRAAYDYTARTGEMQRELLHREFVWDMTTFRDAILPGTYVGVDGANRFLAEWLESFEYWPIDLEEIFDFGERVVAVARQRGQTRQGTPEVEMRFAMLWTLRDGLAVRMEMYANPNEAFEAAGPRE